MSLESSLQDSSKWNAVVMKYARVFEPLSRPYGMDTLNALGDMSHKALLEVAAGTGAVALEAARRGASVTAIDSSEAMVSHLCERATSSNEDRVTAKVMDGESLRFPAASFDAACSVFGVFLFPDFRGSLQEIRRVLRPGAKLAIAVWRHPEHLEHFSLWRRAIDSLYDGFGGFEQTEGWIAMQSSHGMARELTEAGFTDVSVLRVSHEWRVESAQSLADNVFDVPFFESIYESLGPKSKDRIKARLVEQLIDERGSSTITLTTEANIGIGVA